MTCHSPICTCSSSVNTSFHLYEVVTVWVVGHGPGKSLHTYHTDRTKTRSFRKDLLPDKDVPGLSLTLLLTTMQRNDATLFIDQYYPLGYPFQLQSKLSLLTLLPIFTVLLRNGIILMYSYSPLLLSPLQRSYGATTDNYYVAVGKAVLSIHHNPNEVKVYF